MNTALNQIQSDQDLTAEQMKALIARMIQGQMSQPDMAQHLTALSEKGETTQEIIGAAQALREKASPINAPTGAIDCCGTGGDGASTYNISTAVAIVAASCGVPIAKHGNRASSSKSGAADVLEALGVNLDCPHERLEDTLKQLNFAFLMAPKHHSAMKHVAAVRKSLKRRTIFNLIGPLANPAKTKKQLIGVYDQALLIPFAEALKALGTTNAWIVHGADGLDEITITGPTHCAILKDGTITQQTLSPEDFGLQTHPPEHLIGGDAQTNAAALTDLLNGKTGAYRDIVLANTAALLSLHTGETDLTKNTNKAAQAIDNESTLTLLKTYIILSNESTS